MNLILGPEYDLCLTLLAMAMGMKVLDHVTTIDRQICTHPCSIGLSSLIFQNNLSLISDIDF